MWRIVVVVNTWEMRQLIERYVVSIESRTRSSSSPLQLRHLYQPSSYWPDMIFFQSLDSPRAYIATQGPSKKTAPDFWRMAWQERTGCIIMLTRVFDFIKVNEVMEFNKILFEFNEIIFLNHLSLASCCLINTCGLIFFRSCASNIGKWLTISRTEIFT